MISPSFLFKLLALRQKLHKRDKWTRQKLEQYQAKALKDLREYAYACSPFYGKFHNGLMNGPLQELPVLTKAELMKYWDEIVTDRSLKLADVQNFLTRFGEKEMFNDKYYVNSTSGSAGLRGIFVYDIKEWAAVIASYTRANDWAGVKAGLTRKLKLAVVSTRTPWH